MDKNQRNYKKLIGFWALVFLVGGIAGIIFGQLVIPWLTNFRPFNKIGWLCHVKEGTTIINRTEKIYLTQDLAYQEAVNRLANSVVAIRAERSIKVSQQQAPSAKPEVLARGSGFILTGDGLIITANVIVPKAATQILVFKDGKEIEARLIKRDEKNNLALLKIDQTNLPVVNLGDLSSVKLGEMVLSVGAEQLKESLNKFTNFGFIRTLLPEVAVTFSENQLATGGLLANLKGEVLGLVIVDKEGKIKIAGEDKIRELIKQ
ncbi:MAG: protease Do [Parcubacteria group bacterium LiPW_39]|nr:MAG: protease Do [Parcubacteria group bacterium LiPW_39]